MTKFSTQQISNQTIFKDSSIRNTINLRRPWFLQEEAKKGEEEREGKLIRKVEVGKGFLRANFA